MATRVETRCAAAPRATYRLQLHAEFDFYQAATVADYLAQLGISHVYCSPYLQAAKGSMHGYDVVDHSRVNQELGGEAGHKLLHTALERNGLHQLLDIVPNHMSIPERENIWWWDVLEDGPSSRYASYFDVDWSATDVRGESAILLPILDDHYGRVLEAGRLRVERQRGSFLLRVDSQLLPLSPRSIEGMLHEAAERCQHDELAVLADMFAALPPATATDHDSVRIRHRDKQVLRTWLERLCTEAPDVATAIDEVIGRTNFDFGALDTLLGRQNYRLAYWRVASQEVEYRRFFDINSLASLRVEDERVFADVHALALEWVRSGIVDGLRVDHVDGLREPTRYLCRLRDQAPRAWIVVEKILAYGERLPPSWPVDGTTGYDFLNIAQGLLIDPRGEKALTDFYQQYSGQSVDWPAIAREKKHRVLRESFAADVDRLVARLQAICKTDWRFRDYTRRDLAAAVREVIACLEVYRTYVIADPPHVNPDDARRITAAIELAKIHRGDVDADLFDLLRDIWLLVRPGATEADFVMRLQQQTSPVMAKGVEDTAYYCYHRLVCLNEVGGEPSRFGTTLEEFHQFCAELQERWPLTLLATSTHDTKRGEDVRARLALLSEIPDVWCAAVAAWTTMNARHWREIEPDRNAEYLFYQTLVGTWPIEPPRALSYMIKAAREAKEHTSWAEQSPLYEEALCRFVEGVLDDAVFRGSLEEFARPLMLPGWINALCQTLLKMTAPGVCDFYQGTELWENNLVDPDNRRPVDFSLRKRLLEELPKLTVEQVLARMEEGLPKMYLIWKCLSLRTARPDIFGRHSSYRPLVAGGDHAEHLVAYVRGGALVIAAPRWPLRLGGTWGNTILDLPRGTWRHVLTGEHFAGSVAAGELLRRFPVALLVYS